MKSLYAILLVGALLAPSPLRADKFEDFRSRLDFFYTDISEQRFEELQKQVAEHESRLVTAQDNSGLHAAVMMFRLAEKYSWPIDNSNRVGQLAKDLAEGSSDLAKYVVDDTRVNPDKIGIWWAGYFATGDTKYLDEVLKYAGEQAPKGDFNAMTVIGAATWSLEAYCEQHESVRSYLTKVMNEPRFANKKPLLQNYAGMLPDPVFVWRDAEGNPIPDTENRKSKNGFSAGLIITDNLDFYRDWHKPEPPSLTIANKASIGQAIIPLIIYVNPKADDDDSINVTCDYTIYRPDGSVSEKIPDVPCGSGKNTASQFNLQLSQSELRWSVDEGDPVGQWTVSVVVKDHNRGLELPLKSTVEITN